MTLPAEQFRLANIANPMATPPRTASGPALLSALLYCVPITKTEPQVITRQLKVLYPFVGTAWVAALLTCDDIDPALSDRPRAVASMSMEVRKAGDALCIASRSVVTAGLW
jgi:hypothetical protein